MSTSVDRFWAALNFYQFFKVISKVELATLIDGRPSLSSDRGGDQFSFVAALGDRSV